MTSRWHKVKTVYNSVSRAFRHDARRNPAGQLAVYELVATIHSIHGDCTRLTNTISRPWYSMLWLWLIAPSCRSDAASAAASGLMGCDAGMSLTSFSDLRSVALAASLTQVTGNDRLTAMTHAWRCGFQRRPTVAETFRISWCRPIHSLQACSVQLVVRQIHNKRVAFGLYSLLDFDYFSRNFTPTW